MYKANFHIDDIRAYVLACHREAHRVAKVIGASYAPQTLKGLKIEYANAHKGIPVSVSGDYCDESILGMVDPSANVALRFVHDWDHVRLNKTTDFADELSLGWTLVETFKKYGPAVAELVQIDMVGSTLFASHEHRFPTGAEVLAYSFRRVA
jgi:hypothetical protein